MQYVLTAHELTDLAKEVAAAVESEEADLGGYKGRERAIKAVLADNGIKYEEGS